jgi:hypothetical protein
MKLLLRTFALLFTALVLPSCLQTETTIHLNKDGSGTLVEQTTFGPQVAAMLAQMAAFGGDAADAKDPLASMFSEDSAKARAKAFGEGVSYEKSEPLTVGGNKGGRTTYRFADINQLRVTLGESMKDLSPMAATIPDTAKPKPIRFSYAAGSLTITMPEPEKAEVAAADASGIPDVASNPQMDEMMKQMLGDMKMSLKLVVEPGIATTDATHRDGKTMTLMEMEMAKLLEKPETLKKLQSADPADPSAAIETLKGLDGVKIESKNQVSVKLD